MGITVRRGAVAAPDTIAPIAGARTGGEKVGRRPLRSRQMRWTVALAGWLARRRVGPNWISLLSVGFAALAGGCLALAGAGGEIPPLRGGIAPMAPAGLFVVAAVAIQLRLLCNLLDGMVAVEGGLGTRSGELFNDLPDRVSDVLILVGAGLVIDGAWGVTLGLVASLLAVLTAYVRLLGASVGVGHQFGGPMAKQHRMAVMTVACVVATPYMVSGVPFLSGLAMAAALALIVVGCAVTIVRRLGRIAAELEAR